MSGLGSGGTEMMCLRLARHWQERFEQHLLAWSQAGGELTERFHEVSGLHIDVRPDNLNSYVGQWLWARHAILQTRPDAILFHCFGLPHLLIASAARAVGVHAMAVSAGNPPPRALAWRARFAIAVLASRVLRCPIACCSSSVQISLRKLGWGLPARTAVLPNGIDVSDTELRSEQTRRQRNAFGPIIGMVARLDPIKDHVTLLQAFSLLLPEFPDAELWIVGDGALRASLQARACELGVEPSVRIFGSRTDIPELLGQMDILAFSTTRDEGFGIALIEAMASRVAIVASDVPACREVLGNGEAGKLVEAGNPGALAGALRELIESTDLRSAMIDAASRRVVREYSIDACASRWEALLFSSNAPFGAPVECAR